MTWRWAAATALVAAGTTALWASAQTQPVSPRPALAPVVHDPRLELRLFAAEPAIVTPIGIAIDSRDRIYVLESHTHLQGPSYKGAASDRVKVFVDADRDARPDRQWVFAEGFEDGMNLAFSPAGELYLVTARSVWALHDRDGDGVSESRTRVLHLAKPEKVYDHAALLGLTFSRDGWLYVSRGNTGGAAWRLEGTDGSTLSGYGDGGNIVRSRADGRELRQVATGFWNPFDLKFDAYGRLLAVDNDPDSRGPNRLVHVVEGGDYGYKALYGESGIHPYVAWNGELPGTLPYAAPLGEAPAGLLIGRTAVLPSDYADELLVSIWEERRLVRVAVERKGTSIQGVAKPLVEGDERFRPVAFATDSAGVVYITDWGLRQYPNHGHGRIWRLAANPGVPTSAPHDAFAPPLADDGMERLRGLAESTDYEDLERALVSDDPFERAAATNTLGRPWFRARVTAATAHTDPRVRIGAMLALQRSGDNPSGEILRRLLGDTEAAVRQAAMMWAGSARLSALEPEIEAAVVTSPPTPELFDVYLATLQQLDPQFARAYAQQAAPYARQLTRVLRPRFLESLIADPERPPALRALAIRHLPAGNASTAFLASLLGAAQPLALRREAVRAFFVMQDPSAVGPLTAIARGRNGDTELRADALVALARQTPEASDLALALLDDADADVRLEAARYLRSAALTPGTRRALTAKARGLKGGNAADIRAQLRFATAGASDLEPAGADSWERLLEEKRGSPATGRRVFFSQAAVCSECHAYERRGGALGPDLSNVNQSKSRRQILEAILDPSAEVSPEYQGWYLRTTAGDVHTGRQIDVGENGKADLFVLGRGFISVPNMSEYGPMTRSLMPDGLLSNLTADDVRHLMAFLEGGSGGSSAETR